MYSSPTEVLVILFDFFFMNTSKFGIQERGREGGRGCRNCGETEQMKVVFFGEFRKPRYHYRACFLEFAKKISQKVQKARFSIILTCDLLDELSFLWISVSFLTTEDPDQLKAKVTYISTIHKHSIGCPAENATQRL